MMETDKISSNEVVKKTRKSRKIDAAELYGSPKDVNNGTLFTTRRELSTSGVHRSTKNSLDVGPYGIKSALVSDDEFILDCWKRIIYEAPLVEMKSKKTSHTVEGFKLSYLNHLPIRLTRSFDHKGGLGPKNGYRYDGLFHVTYYWETIVDDIYICRRFELNFDLTSQKYLPPPALHLRSDIDSNVTNIAENKRFYSRLRTDSERKDDNGRLINSEVKDDDLIINFLHINRDQRRNPNAPYIKIEDIKDEVNESMEENLVEEIEEIIEIEENNSHTCEDIDIKIEEETTNMIKGFRIYNWPDEQEQQEKEESDNNEVENPIPTETPVIKKPIRRTKKITRIRKIRIKRLNKKYKAIINSFLNFRVNPNSELPFLVVKCSEIDKCVHDMSLVKAFNLIAGKKICPCSWRFRFTMLSKEIKALSNYIIADKDSDCNLVKACKESAHMSGLIESISSYKIVNDSYTDKVDMLLSQFKTLLVKNPIFCLRGCKKIKKKVITTPEPDFCGFSTDFVTGSKSIFANFKALAEKMKTRNKKIDTEKPCCSKDLPVVTIDD